MSRQRLIRVGAAAVFIGGFAVLAFTGRDDFGLMLGLFALLFALYAGAWKQMRSMAPVAIAVLVIAVRTPFFFNLPELSEDFYRFLWDGMLLQQGINPFALAPVDLDLNAMSDPTYARSLLDGMNSREYISVYPPAHQLFFVLGDFFASHALLAGVNAMRCGILILEMALLLVAFRGDPAAKGVATAYLLNPLVVAEGFGNVHLEAVVVPLLVMAALLFSKGRSFQASLAWMASALVKLTPLMLAPYFWWKLDWKARLAFFLVPGLALLAMAAWMWPVWGGLLAGEGLGVYFKSFEFNASLYYVFSRGFEQFLGYNPIGFMGPTLALISVGLIAVISYRGRRANIWEVFLLIYLVYYLMATTVHPWYVVPVVYFALAARRPLLLIWSFSAWLSYTHYFEPIGPRWGSIAIEYGLLAAALIVETRRRPWLQPSTDDAALRG